jgi:hypothetical protein
MKEYAGKDIEIISQTGDFTKEYIPMYQELLEKHKGKRILII